jgi:hypothetical protein
VLDKGSVLGLGKQREGVQGDGDPISGELKIDTGGDVSKGRSSVLIYPNCTCPSYHFLLIFCF